MSSDYGEPEDEISNLEPILKAFRQIRQDNADLILLLEARRDRGKQRSPSRGSQTESKARSAG
jgi:hypothetical protein